MIEMRNGDTLRNQELGGPVSIYLLSHPLEPDIVLEGCTIRGGVRIDGSTRHRGVGYVLFRPNTVLIKDCTVYA